LEVGCGKGYLVYEIKKIPPSIKISGFDVSRYIKKAKKDVKNNIKLILIYRN
jgi:ubiquinone/menaquinone biosynthesis C-methylase UbiE